MRRVPKEIEYELNATGLPWDVELGGKHVKIKLAGRLVGILPLNGRNIQQTNSVPMKNTIAQIRRAARELSVI